MAESGSAARPEWSSAPWRPKPGVRANPVTRKPQRKTVDGCATGADSVPALMSQQGVSTSEANGWLHLGASGGAYGRHGDALARTRPLDGAANRPFFAELVADTRPRSLRDALEAKARGADPARGVAGEPTASKHLRSAEARHQREQLRRPASRGRSRPSSGPWSGRRRGGSSPGPRPRRPRRTGHRAAATRRRRPRPGTRRARGRGPSTTARPLAAS